MHIKTITEDSGRKIYRLDLTLLNINKDDNDEYIQKMSLVFVRNCIKLTISSKYTTNQIINIRNRICKDASHLLYKKENYGNPNKSKEFLDINSRLQLHHTPQHMKDIRKSPSSGVVMVLVQTDPVFASTKGGEESKLMCSLYLMGYQTRGYMCDFTINSTTEQANSYTSRLILKDDILKLDVVQKNINKWSEETQPPISKKRQYSDSSNSEVAEITDEPSKRMKSEVSNSSSQITITATNIAPTKILVPLVQLETCPVKPYFHDAIYVFNQKSSQCHTFPLSISRFIAKLQSTCKIYSRVFSEWRSLCYNQYQFESPEQNKPLFLERCSLLLQHESEGNLIYGSCEQAIHTEGCVLHSMAQSCALMAVEQEDQGMMHWFVTCWSIVTKVRLLYDIYNSACDYDDPELAPKYYQLGIHPERGETPKLLRAHTVEEICTETMRNNGFDITSSEDKRPSDRVDVVLKTGIVHIYKIIGKYIEAFKNKKDEALRKSTKHGYPVIMKTAYVETCTAYSGSCSSIARCVSNVYDELSEKRRIHEDHRRGSETIVFCPELFLPSPWKEPHFGFSEYWTTEQKEIQDVHSKISWKTYFHAIMGFNPPSISKNNFSLTNTE